MHSIFLDEAYHDADSGRRIVVGAWAVDQARLASHEHLLGELRKPGRSQLIRRIAAFFESLNAQALIASAQLPHPIFRTGRSIARMTSQPWRERTTSGRWQ
jgi:hypothetical protein